MDIINGEYCVRWCQISYMPVKNACRQENPKVSYMTDYRICRVLLQTQKSKRCYYESSSDFRPLFQALQDQTLGKYSHCILSPGTGSCLSNATNFIKKIRPQPEARAKGAKLIENVHIFEFPPMAGVGAGGAIHIFFMSQTNLCFSWVKPMGESKVQASPGHHC